jgi:hypothetical protein
LSPVGKKCSEMRMTPDAATQIRPMSAEVIRHPIGALTAASPSPSELSFDPRRAPSPGAS